MIYPAVIAMRRTRTITARTTHQYWETASQIAHVDAAPEEVAVVDVPTDVVPQGTPPPHPDITTPGAGGSTFEIEVPPVTPGRVPRVCVPVRAPRVEGGEIVLAPRLTAVIRGRIPSGTTSLRPRMDRRSVSTCYRSRTSFGSSNGLSQLVPEVWCRPELRHDVERPEPGPIAVAEGFLATLLSPCVGHPCWRCGPSEPS